MFLENVLLILFIQNWDTSAHIVHYDHYKRNISDTPFCSCGHNEDVYHFFFVCKNYFNARNKMFNQLSSLDLVSIDTNLLLCGDVHLTLQTNINILSVVHKFTAESTRFT